MQVMYTAPLEEAHLPASWKVFQVGSFYHWEGQPFAPGIFGQTFSGFVDAAGGFQMMYPSLSRQGIGTINLARARDFTKLKSRGFWVSAPAGDHVTVFSKTFDAFVMNATATAASRQINIRIDWSF